MNTMNKKTYFLAGLLICCLCQVSVAQITNRIIKSSDSKKYGVLQSKARNIPAFQLPAFESKSSLREDTLNALVGKPFRFGKDFAVVIDFLPR
jgi:hypothetical protein